MCLENLSFVLTFPSLSGCQPSTALLYFLFPLALISLFAGTIKLENSVCNANSLSTFWKITCKSPSRCSLLS